MSENKTFNIILSIPAADNVFALFWLLQVFHCYGVNGDIKMSNDGLIPEATVRIKTSEWKLEELKRIFDIREVGYKIID